MGRYVEALFVMPMRMFDVNPIDDDRIDIVSHVPSRFRGRCRRNLVIAFVVGAVVLGIGIWVGSTMLMIEGPSIWLVGAYLYRLESRPLRAVIPRPRGMSDAMVSD
ncbi:MAG: hypothetical protein DCC68_03600 [Planctomycetota bacterium]|nr:MAG: hypothetical protein DCC68_03600 [Planctomycetota bacterium]